MGISARKLRKNSQLCRRKSTMIRNHVNTTSSRDIKLNSRTARGRSIASRLQVFGLSSAWNLRNHISSISTLTIQLRNDRCSDLWTNKAGRAEEKAGERDSCRLTLISRKTHHEHSWRHFYFRDRKIYGFHSRTKNSCSPWRLHCDPSN